MSSYAAMQNIIRGSSSSDQLTVSTNNVGLSRSELVNAIGSLSQSTSVHRLLLLVIAPDTELLGNTNRNVRIDLGDGSELVHAGHDGEVVLVRHEGAANVGRGGDASIVVRQILVLFLLEAQGGIRGGLGRAIERRVIVGFVLQFAIGRGRSSLAYPYGHDNAVLLRAKVET